MNQNIIHRRGRGGSADIGTKEDGAIIRMLPLNGRVLVLKERSVYEFRFADDIDPNREHPNLPTNTHRLLLKIGTESEVFSRIFLTAERLIDLQFLPSTINVSCALEKAFEAIQELSIMVDEIEDFVKSEQMLISEYENNKGKNHSHSIPAITNVLSRCTTIFQKADHFFQALMDIIRLFYPEIGDNRYYSDFANIIEDKYGEQDGFHLFLSEVLPFINLIRNIRNCLEHRRNEIIIKDFELQFDSKILTPAIEIDYNGSRLNKVALSNFMLTVKNNMVVIFESMIAHLCNKNIKSTRADISKLVVIPEEKRRMNKFINYAYWSAFGPDGFYHE
jgi:hypothetical protein